MTGTGLTHYGEQHLLDFVFHGSAAPTIPASGMYIGLLAAPLWTASAAKTVGNWIVPNTGNGHMYRCTTAGTTGTTEPTWPTTANGTVTDGTVVWTEGTGNLEQNTNLPEVSGGSYARQQILHGASTNNGASTGSVSAPLSDTTYPASGTAGTDWGMVTGVGYFDALTAGNMYAYGFVSVPKRINVGDKFIYSAASTMSID